MTQNMGRGSIWDSIYNLIGQLESLRNNMDLYSKSTLFFWTPDIQSLSVFHNEFMTHLVQISVYDHSNTMYSLVMIYYDHTG